MPAWTWEWHPHPEVWVLVVVLILGYAHLLRRVGPKAVAPGEPVATRAHIRNFAIGVGAILVGAEWPMHDLAEGYLYSAHMIQHMLLTLITAPLFLCAMPAWMARALLPGPAMGIARALGRPVAALLLFNGVLVLTHWPTLVNAAAGNELLHFSLHALILSTAMIMWLPVLSPVIEIPRMSYPGQMMYLFLQSLVPTVPASFLTFGERPLYEVYTRFPNLWNISDLSDQRTAGLLMKIGGGLAIWLVISVIFFKWASMERSEGVDALGMRDVDRDLNRMELTRR